MGYNGGFAFARLSTDLCARLQRRDLFINGTAMQYPVLKRDIVSSFSVKSVCAWKSPVPRRPEGATWGSGPAPWNMKMMTP